MLQQPNFLLIFRRLGVYLTGLAMVLLAGCQTAPPPQASSEARGECWSSTAGAPAEEETGENPVTDSQANGQTEAIQVSQIVIGIDGSGSLLGYLQGGDNVWMRNLSALQLLAATQPLANVAVRRVGGARPEPVASLQVSANPCFFTGCEPFSPVSSNLPALWREVQPGQMAILVSDLETDAALTGALVRAINQSKPEAIGLVAVQIPFNGQLFDPSTGEQWKTMNGNRPLYLLVTGPKSAVEAISAEAKAAFGQVGLQPVFSSRLPASTASTTAYAGQLQPLNDAGAPDPQQASVGGKVNVGSVEPLTIIPRNHVLTVSWPPGTGQSRQVALSLQGFLDQDQGVAYPPGQLDLEQYNPDQKSWEPAQGVVVQHLRQQNSNLSATFSLDPQLPAGVVRALLPAHRSAEDWWLALNASTHETAEGGTKGLYGLLTSLQATMQDANPPPATAFCFAHSPT